MERETILNEARRWVGYTESNYCDYLEYDSQQGGHGKNNYNRFSWIFDHLAAPKTYAGGNKDGYAWCATFVATTIGVCDFVEKNHLVHEIVSAPAAMRAEMRRCYCSNLDRALGLKGTPLASASMLAGVSSFPRSPTSSQRHTTKPRPPTLSFSATMPTSASLRQSERGSS